jgi:hypothetical protein
MGCRVARDVWRLHTLPGLTRNTGKAPEARNHLRFDHLTQPWLRELAKRWARLRLSTGLTVSSVINDVTALRRFSTFLDHALPTVDTAGTTPCRPLRCSSPGTPRAGHRVARVGSANTSWRNSRPRPTSTAGRTPTGD